MQKILILITLIMASFNCVAGETNICITNPSTKDVTINITDIDNYDWDDNDNRPDHNFNNITIKPDEKICKLENVNSGAHPKFTFIIDGHHVRLDKGAIWWNSINTDGRNVLFQEENCNNLFDWGFNKDSGGELIKIYKEHCSSFIIIPEYQGQEIPQGGTYLKSCKNISVKRDNNGFWLMAKCLTDDHSNIYKDASFYSTNGSECYNLANHFGDLRCED